MTKYHDFHFKENCTAALRRIDAPNPELQHYRKTFHNLIDQTETIR